MTRCICIITVVLVGCGGAPPKPPELAALEALRKSREAGGAAKVQPDLVVESDRLKERSTGAWKDGELEDSREHALQGWIKLKTAISELEAIEAKRRSEVASAELARSDKEYARIAKDLKSAEDQIALLDKLSNTKSKAEQEKQKLTAELAQQQQRGDTQNRISAAQLALQTADTVDAKTYAKVEYQAAVDLMARAQTELKAGNATAAATSADQAKQKAEQATAIARPEYVKATENKDKRARDEALNRDAAALSGVTVKLDKKGETTRLVLVYGGAWKGKATQISPGKDGALNGIAELLKKYPSYPVQIIGHTDTTGKRDANLVISQARAQAVFDALVTRGIEAKRFVVSGVGTSQPIADNRSPAGRSQNNRVELVFLYQ